MRLAEWLQERGEETTRRWLHELRRGPGGGGKEENGLLGALVAYMVSFLPACVGQRRDEGMAIWQQATHLYGSLAVRRGLAAGEVVEEIQLLRGVILRLYLADFSEGGGEARGGIRPREILALNEVLDAGVARASIAYVDDLFFAHVQGPGFLPEMDEETSREILRQLEGFREELPREE